MPDKKNDVLKRLVHSRGCLLAAAAATPNPRALALKSPRPRPNFSVMRSESFIIQVRFSSLILNIKF